MNSFCRRAVAVCLLAAAWYTVTAETACAAEEETDTGLVQMVVELIKDADRDMHALVLQQVREELPGEAVTRQLVDLLPELPPERRAGLIEALGERGDRAAREAAVEMARAGEEVVRAAALRALGRLGDASHIELLASKAASGSDQERAAARESLQRLGGQGIDEAMIAAAKEAEAPVRVELLAALAARNVRAAMPVVLDNVRAGEPEVRQAALDALRYLAEPSQIETVVELIKELPAGPEQTKATLVLLALSSRDGAACAPAIAAGLEGAAPTARIALLHGLARAGGPEALEAVSARLEDEDAAVRDEAVRILARWPDPAAAETLRRLAAHRGNLRWHVLALRGLVRLAQPDPSQPANLKLVAEALQLAARPEEKRLVLAAAATVPSPEALSLVLPLVDDEGLSEEAALAAVLIAEKMKKADQPQLQAAMKKVISTAKNSETIRRAKKVLAVGKPAGPSP
ncbi:MAG TPA: hypothetical protein EYP56_18880 [Planctomycetaceae bacterium]|nr:hypothetical protein [Planctomycetaceae bacterium]